MFYKMDVLKNFAKFTGKTSSLESIFNKVAARNSLTDSNTGIGTDFCSEDLKQTPSDSYLISFFGYYCNY